MDLYNNEYVANTAIDLRNVGLIKRTTHIYKAWADSLGDVHLDVQIDCTDKDGEAGSKWIIPDLCIPMDGIIHLKTIKDSGYCTPVSTWALFELRRDITLQQGRSESPFVPPEKASSSYYVTFERLASPVKKMTLEEIEQKLGYMVQVVSEKSIKKE